MKAFALAACWLLLLGCGRNDVSSQIRVKNGSNQDFRSVIVAGTVFGDLKSGAVSDYRTFPQAYIYMNASALVGTNKLHCGVPDYEGLKPLGKGRFTYVIGVKENRLSMGMEQDQ